MGGKREGRGRRVGCSNPDLTDQPTNQTQTLIPDLWQRNGEAYQVQQSADVPTDGKIPLSSLKSQWGAESAQQSRSAHEPSSLLPFWTRCQTPDNYTTHAYQGLVALIEKNNITLQWYIPQTNMISEAAAFSKGGGNWFAHLWSGAYHYYHGGPQLPRL